MKLWRLPKEVNRATADATAWALHNVTMPWHARLYCYWVLAVYLLRGGR